MQGLPHRAVQPLHLVGEVLLAYAAVSITWSIGDKWMAYAKLAALSLPFLAGMWLRSLNSIWKGVIWIVGANLAASVVEYYGWGWEGYGLAGNPNYLGVALAIALAAALGNRWWYYVPILIAGVVWTYSRGAIMAGGVAIIIGLWHTHRATGWIACLLSILAIITLKAEGEAGAMAQRLGIWQDTINHLTFWGSGWGSFQQAYEGFAVKTNMTAMLTTHAYNDILETMFELGIGSVLVWWLIALCWQGQNRTDRLVCVTFAVAGFTYFPLWVVGPLFTLTLGHLSQTKDEKPWLAGTYGMLII